MNKENFMISRIYTSKNGETHFEDLEINLKQENNKPLESQLFHAEGIIFRKAPNNQKRGWHLAPQKQLVVSLSGIATITTSDGEKREFGPGSILLVDDTEKYSKGHTTVVNKDTGERKTLFIPIDINEFNKL
ncbi:MAG: hypothetical protein QMB22_03430 [Dehalococcoidia bacterium]|jgi:hypothetical protein|nr:MAG: hypothetical protein DK305_000959 [Chloroflexota bacterium]|tara:strand:+ start:150 stop:545 length:396 start_codon:yes stop_codon:yes gene_type:complete